MQIGETVFWLWHHIATRSMLPVEKVSNADANDSAIELEATDAT